MTASTDFYESIAPFPDFGKVLDPVNYHPLPADWLAGVADVVDSTGAIAAGRYKTVNMVGAAVIAAVLNATGGRQFPFVFGGDGAGFAIPPDAAPAVRDALARTVTWASEEMGLGLRAALLSVADIRASGFDLTVARYAPSAAVAAPRSRRALLPLCPDQIGTGGGAVCHRPAAGGARRGFLPAGGETARPAFQERQ
jgi:Protein of unknown function (DUF3095)